MTTRRILNESPEEKRIRLEHLKGQRIFKEKATHADFWKAQALRKARSAIKLTLALSPAGFWTIGLVMKNGQVVGDGYLDIAAGIMGAIECIYWLQRWGRRVKSNGDQVGPTIDYDAVDIVYGEDELIQ